MYIKNIDLYKKQFKIDELKQNINNLNKKIILKTQKLTADFCIKYILDLEIDNGDENSYIFDEIYIRKKQPHITDDEWNTNIIFNYLNRLIE